MLLSVLFNSDAILLLNEAVIYFYFCFDSFEAIQFLFLGFQLKYGHLLYVLSSQIKVIAIELRKYGLDDNLLQHGISMYVKYIHL